MGRAWTGFRPVGNRLPALSTDAATRRGRRCASSCRAAAVAAVVQGRTAVFPACRSFAGVIAALCACSMLAC